MLIEQGHIPACLLDWHVSEKYCKVFVIYTTACMCTVAYRSISSTVSALLKLYVTCYYNFHLWSCPPSHRVCMYSHWCSVNSTVMQEFSTNVPSHCTCNCCVRHGQHEPSQQNLKVLCHSLANFSHKQLPVWPS